MGTFGTCSCASAAERQVPLGVFFPGCQQYCGCVGAVCCGLVGPRRRHLCEEVEPYTRGKEVL